MRQSLSFPKKLCDSSLFWTISMTSIAEWPWNKNLETKIDSIPELKKIVQYVFEETINEKVRIMICWSPRSLNQKVMDKEVKQTEKCIHSLITNHD